ncbi:hypothetical protein BD779DRAFT_472803 [Infundibulicybe gibba]|nr:hypothetical protein BD779DRAFT_472803 [Infundibulicybe gibba]
MAVADDEADDKDPPRVFVVARAMTPLPNSSTFSLFPNDFGPPALLYSMPTLTTPMNYSEGLNPSASHNVFSIVRPTIEQYQTLRLSHQAAPSPATAPRTTADGLGT